MAAPQSVSEFKELLQRSGLLPKEVLASFFHDAEGNPITDIDALAERLVEERLLTSFHVHQLKRGRADGFFLTEKYKVLDFIGSGGMGKVFLCEHLLLHRVVAIKLLQTPEGDESQSTQGIIERFYREARAVAALDHPNIVRVFDVDRAAGNPFMVMEYVDGSNLQQIVHEAGPLSAERAAHYIAQAAAGLEHADRCGLVHRDIKPGNILLDRTGVVKILDLGLARFSRDMSRNHSITAKFDTNSVLGTVDYMAPEQAGGLTEVDIRADIYSLGCTMYYLLTRSVPFPEGTIPMKMYYHQTRAPEPLSVVCPRIPREFSEVLERMMAKAPEDRFQKAQEVIDALTPWTQTPISPPSRQEMPATPVSIYKLGLSPPPISTTATSATPHPLAGAETIQHRRPNALQTPTQTNPIRPVSSSADPSLILDPVEASSAPKQVPRRRMIWLILVGVVVAGGVGATVLWWLLLHDRQKSVVDSGSNDPGETKTPPEKEKGNNPKTETPVTLTLEAGGSTFVKPIMDRWAEVYKDIHRVKIDYQGVGSGRGVQRMVDRIYGFGCTDAPMTLQELADADRSGGKVLHIPLVMGAVVPAYKVSGLSTRLKFASQTLVKIYLGKITHWDDQAIRINNPGVALPHLEITVVHRKESSGTTHIWTEYLAKASLDWEKEIGIGKLVKWPCGISGEGNNGVATLINRTDGAIGYIELTYALQNDLTFGAVINKAGEPIIADERTVSAAATASLHDIPEDLRYSLTNAEGKNSYPIVGTTWAVLYVDQLNNSSAKEMVEFLRWATHKEGQEYLKELKYVPLPPELVKKVEGKLAQVRFVKK
jgi:phosphate ABC transporter phosphate-binding protein